MLKGKMDEKVKKVVEFFESLGLRAWVEVHGDRVLVHVYHPSGVLGIDFFVEFSGEEIFLYGLMPRLSAKQLKELVKILESE